jgi:hypothetical protein
MRIDALTITEFKNLKDLQVDFDENSPFTVLVGENGAGKSNLLEAIAWIFRNLDLELPAPFTYSIRYRCRGNEIEVTADKHQSPQVKCRSAGRPEYSELSKKEFMMEDERGRPLYRPGFVFGYYSGPSDRLATVFQKHQECYYSWIIRSRAQRRGRSRTDPNTLRRLFYAQTLHGQFALLAFFMEEATNSDDRAFLREELQIEGLDSVLFALKRPPWIRKGGDPRFWNAEGEVKAFLARLYDSAMLPTRMDRRIPVDLTKNPSVESLYLFLPGADALRSVYQSYSDQYSFFTALESTHLSILMIIDGVQGLATRLQSCDVTFGYTRRTSS